MNSLLTKLTITSNMNKITKKFYKERSAIEAAKDLLGKQLCTCFDGNLTSGLITETEAYMGEIDKACHAHGGNKTPRTSIMYKEAGTAYIYLIYGIHYLLNVTVAEKNNPECVLIRGIKPNQGIQIMKERRKTNTREINELCNGPGKLTQALGIDKNMNGIDVTGTDLWLEEGIEVNPDQIESAKRVGIDYAKEFRDKKWRFYIKI